MKRRKVGLIQHMEYEFAQMDPGMTNKEQKRKVKEGRVICSLLCILRLERVGPQAVVVPSLTLPAQ